MQGVLEGRGLRQHLVLLVICMVVVVVVDVVVAVDKVVVVRSLGYLVLAIQGAEELHVRVRGGGAALTFHEILAVGHASSLRLGGSVLQNALVVVELLVEGLLGARNCLLEVLAAGVGLVEELLRVHQVLLFVLVDHLHQDFFCVLQPLVH